MRPCKACGETKPLTDFSPNRTARLHICKPCNAERARVARGRPRLALPVRFWAKAAEPNDRGCRIWQGARAGSRREYGIAWNGTRLEMAHRIAYWLTYGPIPQGLVIDHLCRMTLCVEPTHLEAVTYRINSERGYGGNVAAGRDR